MKNSTVLTLIAIFILAIIFCPWLFIWSLNTLFSLHIPFNSHTWFAALVLSGLMSGGYGFNKK